MLTLYTAIMRRSGPLLRRLLRARLARGREDAGRLPERMGQPSRPRPDGRLIWLHVASVGEGQSALKLVDLLLARDPGLHLLVTSGTVTSARLLGDRLPPRALHQFYPLDHPGWIATFLDHWRPDLALWLESELWPNMLGAIRQRQIPAILLNARLSEKSEHRWGLSPRTARRVVSVFTLILAQTDDDAARFRRLGAIRVEAMANLKYAADRLPCDGDMLNACQELCEGRPAWVFASTHAGEEAMAARVHARLRSRLPGLLTVIVPRHPERGAAIVAGLHASEAIALRSEGHAPSHDIELYIADTLGELGLFYRLCAVACVGRSFSDDGGGGHNPLEAAMLGAAVLHGPMVQNLAAIYADMDAAGAAVPVADEAVLETTLARLLGDQGALAKAQRAALDFATDRAGVADAVIDRLSPWLGGPA